MCRCQKYHIFSLKIEKNTFNNYLRVKMTSNHINMDMNGFYGPKNIKRNCQVKYCSQRETVRTSYFVYWSSIVFQCDVTFSYKCARHLHPYPDSATTVRYGVLNYHFTKASYIADSNRLHRNVPARIIVTSGFIAARQQNILATENGPTTNGVAGDEYALDVHSTQ